MYTVVHGKSSMISMFRLESQMLPAAVSSKITVLRAILGAKNRQPLRLLTLHSGNSYQIFTYVKNGVCSEGSSS